MPPSAVTLPSQATSQDEAQKIAAASATDSHDVDQEAPDGNGGKGEEDAESVDSNITQEIGTEGLLRHAADYRERKITLGGKPTRPIAEYNKEREQQRLFLTSPDQDPDKEYYHHYCRMERNEFYHELLAWESFLRWIRREWVKRDEAAGGSVPPPPPILEWDPLDLHTQYLCFLLQIRKADEGKEEAWRIQSWHFHSYYDFLVHIAAVERQVAELREQQGEQQEVKDDARFQEQLGVVHQLLADARARQEEQDSEPPPFLASFGGRSASSPKPGETQAHGSRRKRMAGTETSGLQQTAKSPKVEFQDHTAPAPKRRKHGGLGSGSDVTTDAVPPSSESRGKGPNSKRGKNTPKTNNEAKGHKVLEPAHNTKKTGGKRKGKPSKPPQTTSTLDKATSGESKAGQKRQGRPSGEAQPRPTQRVKAEVKQRTKQQTNATAPSAPGVRRSGRIAAQCQGGEPR